MTFWTGSLNDGQELQRSVRLYDTTLRDGEQTVGVALGPEAKLRIAQAIDALGVGRIEAGFPRVSEEDTKAFAMVLDAGLDAEIWGFARAVRADVDALLDLGVRAAVIESPISDMKLQALGVSKEDMLRRITEAVSYAVEKGITVAYFGVDGSRADLGYFEQVYRRAVEAGASEVVVVDTIGIATPEAAGDLVARTLEWVGGVPVHFHGHNDFGLATAAAVAAVRAGASWIQGTVNGMGERAGNANLIEVALALEGLYGVETGLRLDRAREVSALVRELSGYELEPWKPVVGENLFVRESGAVASQFHIPEAIEPFSSDLVGAERRIVLGKKSGIDSIRIKCEVLGIDVPEDQRRDLLASVKKRAAAKGGLLDDDEFVALVGELDAR
jgi:isopropylmalate/homocitrate/citramalate synthase